MQIHVEVRRSVDVDIAGILGTVWNPLRHWTSLVKDPPVKSRRAEAARRRQGEVPKTVAHVTPFSGYRMCTSGGLSEKKLKRAADCNLQGSSYSDVKDSRNGGL